VTASVAFDLFVRLERMAQTMTSPTHSTASPVELTADNPIRPVDWRWQRAVWRVETRSRRGERHDDDWTRQAIRCVKAIHREAGGRMPYRPEPELLQARQLAQQHDWHRAELESRILADQAISEISTTMRIPVGVVAGFEALFFDVRSRLEAATWIVHEVLGSKPCFPLQPMDVADTWKSLGFGYGVSTVDALVAGADLKDLETIGLPAYWSPGSRLPKELQFLLLTGSLPEYGRRTLRSLSRLTEVGLCHLPSYAAPPPTGLSLDMGAANLLDDILSCEPSFSLSVSSPFGSGEYSRAA